MRAALYVWVTGADLGASVEDKLPELRRHAAGRGWPVVSEIHDATGLVRTPKRPGMDELAALVGRREVDVVLVESFSGLFRDAAQMAKVGEAWSAAGIAFVALQDAIDTTEVVDRLRFAAACSMLVSFLAGRHRKATILGQLRSSLGVGRPEAIVNPLELRQLLEAGLSRREIQAAVRARGGKISDGTLAKAIGRMTAAGQFDEATRAKAIAKRGGLPRGGRPVTYDRVPLAELVAIAEAGESITTATKRLKAAGMTISPESLYHQLRVAKRRGQIVSPAA